jgi:hypothetical protein
MSPKCGMIAPKRFPLGGRQGPALTVLVLGATRSRTRARHELCPSRTPEHLRLMRKRPPMHEEAEGNRLRMLAAYGCRTWRVVRRDPAYLPRVIWALVRDPVEGRERSAERLGEWTAARVPRPAYRAAPDWEATVHRSLGAAWPCPACAEFASLWTSVLGALSARGLGVGRGAYGGWDDADPALPAGMVRDAAPAPEGGAGDPGRSGEQHRRAGGRWEGDDWRGDQTMMGESGG